MSDEELNAAYDARLKSAGVILDTSGMTLQQQIDLGIEVNTDGLSLEEEREANKQALDTWYERI